MSNGSDRDEIPNNDQIPQAATILGEETLTTGDQAKIGMFLAPNSDSLSLILGHFPVFNMLKLSVSGFIRFQKQLR